MLKPRHPARNRVGPDRRAALILLVFLGPLVSGCFSEDLPEERPTSPGWEVGDRWVYLRSGGNATGIYTREVTGLFDKRGHEVFEMTEGLRGTPYRQYSLYTVDRLRFMGMEMREGSDLRTRMDPEAPLLFHYVFPLNPGETLEQSGRIHQTAGSVQQVDKVEIQTRVDAPTDLALGERIYRVFPYEVRIRYTTTPFDDVAIIRGHWSPGIGQSVLTTVHEGGDIRTYELLSFTRQRPVDGGPAYRLAEGLASQPLERGFDATLERAGYARYLFHVETPTTVRMEFSLTAEHDRVDRERVDMVALRPLGHAASGVSRDIADVADPGVVLHMAAGRVKEAPLVFHTPGDGDLEQVRLHPGQVYEMIVASNIGPVSAVLTLGSERQAMDPVERGRLEVLSVDHRRVYETRDTPGPQNVRDSVRSIVSVPEGARIDGIVYAINRDGSERAIGEVEAQRRISYGIDGVGYTDEDSLYGFFMGYRPRGPFTAEAAFEYRAEFAVRGVVHYEVGALLVRLVPPA